MSSTHRYLCGVPNEHCAGGVLHTDQQLPQKCHGSRKDAFNCMKRYMLSSGFVQVGSREFRNPETGCITVLNKQSKFGGELRQGKEGRYMPKRRNAGIIF